MAKLSVLVALWGLFLTTKIAVAQQSSTAFQQDTARISACIGQARKYLNNQQTDSVLYFIQQGFQLSKKWNITTYHSRLYRRWGSYYRLTNEADKVVMMFQRARLWAWRNGNKNEIAENGYALAVAYNLKLSLTKSKFYQTALIRQLYENLRFAALYNTTAYLDGTYSLLAALSSQYGNDSLRYYYFTKLLPLVKSKTGLTNHIEYFYFSFSLSLYHKDLKAAQGYYQAFLNIKNKQDFIVYYAYAATNMLNDCIKFGEWGLASQITNYIQKELVTYIPKRDLYVFYTNLTSLHIHNKNYVLATQAIEKVRQCATEIEDIKIISPVDRVQFLENEQKIAEYNQQYPQALILYKRVASAKDSLRVLYGSFDLLVIEERMASEQKERDFKRQLQLKRLENQRETKQNQLVLWIVGIIIVSLSAVIVFISRQIKQIKAQRLLLEELNQTKDRLFTIIGHDLRSPILSTKTSLRRLISQKQLTIDEMNTAVRKQIPRLQTLLLTVDNLLYWSQNQQLQPRIKRKEVQLIDIVEEIVETLNESIEVSQLSIHQSVPDTLRIYVDPNHLRIIIRNIIQNAIKFTSPQGHIFVEVMPTSDDVILCIKDTGIGFEQSKEQKLKQGTGLGLKLVKELLELNDGTLEIINTQDNGAEVRLHFQKFTTP